MRKLDLRRHAPVILIVFLVITPLAIWAATSGGSGDGDKRVYRRARSVGLTGEPELLVTVDDRDVEVTNGRTRVEVECAGQGRQGDRQGHPAVALPARGGLPAARARRPTSPDEVERARRCRVLGTNKRLEANVQ